jgi:hypothetical protein
MLLSAQPKRGASSFCIPRTAIQALIDHEASAYEVIAYLVLARFTDATGCYSTASSSAIRRYSSSNQGPGGPIDRALERLVTIAPKGQPKMPILWTREAWLKNHDTDLPDGPTERGLVRYVLPDFDEDLGDRVWFGAGLVDGFGEFQFPLKRLKQCGDIAARLLIAQYMAHDLGAWGGINPNASYALWQSFSPACKPLTVEGGATLIRWQEGSTYANDMASLMGKSGDREAFWQAAQALGAAGFFYQVVMVLDRAAVKRTLPSGDTYYAPTEDAEPVCELDTRSRHGYKPKGEQGVGGFTARTAGDLGHGVATQGEFNGTYAAFLPPGMSGMIVGIYRLRFRLVNPHNRDVKLGWLRIKRGNREQLRLIEHVRAKAGLAPLQAKNEGL